MSASLAESVQQDIIKLITTNELNPGDKLPTEYELADKLNVGRSTIREAVKALASRNILKIKQGSGTFVSPGMGITKDPLGLSLICNDVNLAFDMINVRIIFEPEMAALAAINATKDDCMKIGTACTIVEDLIKNNEEYSKADSSFHEAIARASGNKIINRIVKVIHSSIQKNIFVTEDSLRNDTLIYHRQIVNAIKEHDVTGARCGMIMHLNNLRNFMTIKKRETR
ncbi:FadR/GntR family transcriptional regulator [Pectinatus cerevisiiphilus]|uniref:DNA-binding FadR family transcriptional regulator n=1 Tax=Pectinatus cerevisiiphilus TaxID=86956 RepID=A0A4R3KB09_9FIRM|nr:FadR/GntR family transcriptional regulator [Pectinatus cerevisiiphilus]TCS80120.1 DNA-binding FadR family transcriptional regulator [Pectinatus cerevisiiphilus]